MENNNVVVLLVAPVVLTPEEQAAIDRVDGVVPNVMDDIT